MFPFARKMLYAGRVYVLRIIRSRSFWLHFRALLLVFMGMAVFCGPADSRSPNDSELEYRVKAAFLLNFTKFVTWPDEVHENKKSPIVLCLLGDSPFGSTLDSIRGKRVHGHPIEIIHAPDPEKIPPCHIVFFGDDLDIESAEILRRLRAKPVLTVGERKGFAHRGGMINFILVENKVRFEINPVSVEAASLKISSQLLKLAVIIKSEKFTGN